MELFSPKSGVYLGGDYYTPGEHLPDHQLTHLTGDEIARLRSIAATSEDEAAQLHEQLPEGAPRLPKDRPGKEDKKKIRGPRPLSLGADRLLPLPVSDPAEGTARPKLGTLSGESLARQGKEGPGLQLGELEDDFESDEKRQLSWNTARGVVHTINMLDSPEYFATVANAGRAKRGWYENAHKGLRDLFGPDTERFVALLAATSPRVSVKKNLEKTLDVYDAWQMKRLALGRDPNAAEVRAMINDLRREGKIDAFLMHDRATASALTHPEPGKATYGVLKEEKSNGLKIDNFRMNLLGHSNRVTNDTWIAYAARVNQSLFAGPQGYHALNTRIRQAAKYLNTNQQPGEKPWTPAEVQESVWSFIMTLARVQGQSRMASGGLLFSLAPKESLDFISHKSIAKATDFITFLTENAHDPASPAARADRILRKLGLGGALDAFKRNHAAGKYRSLEPTGEVVSPTVGDPAKHDAFLERAARAASRAMSNAKRMEFARKVREAAMKFAHSWQASPQGQLGNVSFMSGNTDTDLDFNSAVQRLRSSNQAVSKKMAGEIFKSIGANNVNLIDAVGDWQDGAENSLVSTVSDPVDPAQVQYAASWFGLATNQKAVLHFHEKPEGPDSVYEIDVPDPSMESVRQRLQASGVPFRTLVPGKQGTKVMIYDEGRQLRGSVEHFARSYDATVSESIGKGTTLGDSSGSPTRTKAREWYRRFIADYESGTGQPQPHQPVQASAAPQPPVRSVRKGQRQRYGRPGSLDPTIGSHVADYLKSAGMNHDASELPYAAIDQHRAAQIADAYEALQHSPHDEKVKAAYAAFKAETLAQLSHLLKQGVQVRPWSKDGQPYANSKEMVEDVRKNKQLFVFLGGEMPEDHPLKEQTGLSLDGKPLTYNDAFRAVHDYYGHAAHGNEFGPRGEQHAWQLHARMFSPRARKAMTTETRGQNSWVNFGKHVRDKQTSATERPYAEQKAGLLPDDMMQLSRRTLLLRRLRSLFSPEQLASWRVAEQDEKSLHNLLTSQMALRFRRSRESRYQYGLSDLFRKAGNWIANSDYSPIAGLGKAGNAVAGAAGKANDWLERQATTVGKIGRKAGNFLTGVADAGERIGTALTKPADQAVAKAGSELRQAFRPKPKTPISQAMSALAQHRGTVFGLRPERDNSVVPWQRGMLDHGFENFRNQLLQWGNPATRASLKEWAKNNKSQYQNYLRMLWENDATKALVKKRERAGAVKPLPPGKRHPMNDTVRDPKGVPVDQRQTVYKGNQPSILQYRRGHRRRFSRQAFDAQLAENPFHAGTHGVYSDYLEEQGDPDFRFHRWLANFVPTPQSQRGLQSNQEQYPFYPAPDITTFGYVSQAKGEDYTKPEQLWERSEYAKKNPHAIANSFLPHDVYAALRRLRSLHPDRPTASTARSIWLPKETIISDLKEAWKAARGHLPDEQAMGFAPIEKEQPTKKRRSKLHESFRSFSRETFAKALEQNPWDAFTHGVYSDYLEEQGDKDFRFHRWMREAKLNPRLVNKRHHFLYRGGSPDSQERPQQLPEDIFKALQHAIIKRDNGRRLWVGHNFVMTEKDTLPSLLKDAFHDARGHLTDDEAVQFQAPARAKPGTQKFAAVKAPAGGIVVRGKFYPGGKVIPTKWLGRGKRRPAALPAKIALPLTKQPLPEKRS